MTPRLSALVALTGALLVAGCLPPPALVASFTPVGAPASVSVPDPIDPLTARLVKPEEVRHKSQSMTLANGQSVVVHVWDGPQLLHPQRTARCSGDTTERNAMLCQNIALYWQETQPAADDFSFPAEVLPKRFMGLY